MPRSERPLDEGDGVLLGFAADLRRLRKKAGSPTYRELAGRVHYSAATLSEAAGGRKLPSLAVALAYVRGCDGDAGEWERRWHAVAAELADDRAEEAGEVREDGADPPPYAGLAAFRTEDADRFFGRERLVEELTVRLSRERFTAVFGASGVGKSSLLCAGLLPRWRSGTEGAEGSAGSAGSAGGAREAVLFVPGPHPLEECAIQLARITGRASGALLAELTADRRALHRTLRQALAERSEGAELLLVVDQFEETFTLCRDPAERARFIEALVTAARAENSRCRVVLGVRADFYAHCTSHPELIEALNDAQIAVGPMSTDELRQAVTQPAVRARCTLESALLADLMAQAHGQVGILPLLSHALLETWRRRRGNTLTLAGYQAAGGIDGALARTAETVYTGLTPHRQRLAKALFLRLTALGEGTEDTKRRIRHGELATADPDTAACVERLAAARLLTLDRDGIEIAHEALIRCWPRLHDWLAQDREGLRIHRRLTEDADAWDSLGRDPGALYRGTRLDLARDWSAARDPQLTSREREFLETSLAAEAAEQAAARRRARRLHRLVALLTALLVLATTAGVTALRAQRQAAEQRDIAMSQRVAEQAAALRPTDPALSAQLGLAAYRLAPTVEARGSLLSTFATPYATELPGHDGNLPVVFRPDGRVLATGGADRTVRLRSLADPHRPRTLAVLTREASKDAGKNAGKDGSKDAGKDAGEGSGEMYAAAFSPDGRLFSVAYGDGTVRLWDVTDPRRPARLPALRAGPVASLAFSPDGRTLATAGDGTIRLWTVGDWRRIAQVSTSTVTTSTGDFDSVAFSPDGRTLAAGNTDHTAWLWDVTVPRRPERLPRLTGHTGAVAAVAFSPDGRTLATGSLDHTARLWDMAEPGNPEERATLTGHTDMVYAVAFSPDGHTLASGSMDATVRLWRVADPGAARQLALLPGHMGAVRSVAFAPDGRTLASGNDDGTARLWELPLPTLTGHSSSVYGVAVAPDGRRAASAGFDNTVRLWDLASRRGLPEPTTLTGHTAAVNTVAFRPDGRLLASGSLDGTMRLWDVADARRPRPLATRAIRGAVNAVAFSPDGRTVAGTETDGVRLWDVTDPARPVQRSRLSAPAEAVAFSPDGRTLAVGGRDRTVRLWDVTEARDPRARATLTGHGGWVKSVAFSPDGRTLATSSQDRTARLWDVSDTRRPRPLATLKGHTRFLHSVAFSPDGRTLATASTDRTVRLWDVADPAEPQESAALTGHTADVNAVAFAPDGRTLLSGANDWVTLLWDPDPERVAARVCRTATPAIGRAEWDQYFPGLDYRPPCR